MKTSPLTLFRVILIGMSLALGACSGGGNDSSGTSDPATDASDPSTEEASEAPPTEDPVTDDTTAPSDAPPTEEPSDPVTEAPADPTDPIDSPPADTTPASATVAVWEEPLASELQYPTIEGIASYWDDGLTPDNFSSIGHSCSFDPSGSGERCGDGVCQASEGTDPTTCWEDCVRQYWMKDGVKTQVTETVSDQVLNKILWYGNLTARPWSEAPYSFIIADGGYMSSNPDNDIGTPGAGYGSQILIVEKLTTPNTKNPYDDNLYCVDTRYRGKALQRLLAWTHSAIPDHEHNILVTNTNDSVLYKLDGTTFEVLWQLDGLHFDSTVSGSNYCRGGPLDTAGYGDCCSETGCNVPFSEGGDALSGDISYENMLTEVWDSARGKYRYLLSNRSWDTVTMIDATTPGIPDRTVTTDTGLVYGNVSWAFGFHGQPTFDDACRTNLPHGARYYPDGGTTGTIYSADMTASRMLAIPYDHTCYGAQTKPAEIVATDPFPRAMVRTDSGTLLVTRDISNNSGADDYPVYEVGGSGWKLTNANLRLGNLYAEYPFDLDRHTFEEVNYITVTAPMCLGGTGGQMTGSALTMWVEAAIDPVPVWIYPTDFKLVCE